MHDSCLFHFVSGENWGPELLDMCKDTSLLILNGRTSGDEAGKYTFGIASSSGRSAIDYFVASAQCMTASVSLQVNEDAEVYCTDHHSVVLHMLCEPLKEYEHNSLHFSTVERVKYDDQNADAYEEYLTAVLHSQWLPLLVQNADVDVLSKSLADLALEAARETTPQARKQRGAAAYVSKPWYDEACKNAYRNMKHVLQCLDNTAEEKQTVQKRYKSVTYRTKKAWIQQRNDELMHMSSKDPKAFWKVYRSRKRDVCPVSPEEQAEAFRKLYGAQPPEPPPRPTIPGVSSSSSESDECMFAHITADELQVCIKRLQRGMSPGIDAVCAEMIKDGGELLHTCLLELFNRMLMSHFPECLSVGVITAVFKAGDKKDMGNYRGITVGPVFAKLFAMIIESRLASWAEDHGVKARGQAGFRKDHRTTDNVFVLRSLIDKQKQSRQRGGSGKLYCCFVDFRKAFDTIPRTVLWQVLEDLGVSGRVLTIIKSMYAQDSAAVKTSAGLSEIFRCLLGVKQGCPLSPTLFGLYVDGLEKHLLQTSGIDAPELIGELVPLLLYADDLILMSTSKEGLQRQIDALADFCAGRQLEVNLSKTKIVVFETRRSDCAPFVFQGKVVERVEEYRYLGFVFHATRNMAYGAEFLVAAAKKAMHAMRRRCIFLGLSDPRSICKLFDMLVLPILSYACEVWAVDPKAVESAEKLHRHFLKRLLGIRNSTSSMIVLAELGRYPVKLHFWQQILRFHNRAVHMPNNRLVKLALLDEFFDFRGSMPCIEGLTNNWRSGVRRFVDNHPGQAVIVRRLDIARIVDREQEVYISDYHTSTAHSSLMMYRALNPEYQPAEYLRHVLCRLNRRLLSRLRCQCFGLQVDIGRFEQISRSHRVCQVCHAQVVEDEQHFLFDCPAYSHIRVKHMSLFQHESVATLLSTSQHSLLGRYVRKCFFHRKFMLRNPVIDVSHCFRAWAQQAWLSHAID